MAIEGPLEELDLQDVLQLLESTRKTGILTVRAEQPADEAVVHFDQGTVIFAARRRSTRRLGQLLVRAGKLTERALEQALDLQRQNPSKRLSDILLDGEAVRREDLERALVFQMAETLHEIIPWREGYFHFEERPTGQGNVVARIKVDSVLMETARRTDEWALLEPKVPGPDAVPTLAVAPQAVDTAPLELRPEHWEILAEVDGEREIRHIAAAIGRSSFDVAKSLFQLVELGVVQIRETRGRSAAREVQEGAEEVERLLAAGATEEAALRLAELELAYPDRADLALVGGRVMAALGRPKAAVEAFARAGELDPLSADAQYHLGFAAIRTGELARASQAWRAFLRLADGDPRRKTIAHALAAAETLLKLLGDEAK